MAGGANPTLKCPSANPRLGTFIAKGLSHGFNAPEPNANLVPPDEDELLKRLHATPVPSVLAAESPWVDRTLAKARENLAWCDGTAELLADLHRRRLQPIPEVLIHGDLALDNVLITSDGAMSLIDWSAGDEGDPRCDFAFALQTEPEIQLSDVELTAFFEGYGIAPIDRITRRWFV